MAMDLGSIGAVHLDASLGTRSWEAGTRRMEQSMSRATRGVNANLRAVDGAMSQVLRTVGRLAAPLAAAFSVVAVQRFTRETLRAADAIEKTSRQIGLASGELQAFTAGAGRAGVAQNQFNAAMGVFLRNVAQAKQGQGALTSGLKDHHSELLKAIRASRDQRQALDAVAEAMEKAESQTERAAIATAAFGCAGLPLIEFLKDGRAGLQDMERQARALGHVLSGEALRGVESFNDAQDDLWRTIRTQIQEGYLSTMNKEVETLADLAGDENFHKNLQATGRWIAYIETQARGAAAGIVSFIGSLDSLMDRAAQIAREDRELFLGLGDAAPEFRITDRLREMAEGLTEARAALAEMKAEGSGAASWQIKAQEQIVESLERQRNAYLALFDPVAGVADVTTTLGRRLATTNEELEETVTTASRAGRAVDTLASAYQSLRDRLDPLGAAQRSRARDAETLWKAYDRGLIPATAELTDMLQKLEEAYADQVDPLRAVMRELREEQNLLGMTAEARDQHVRLLEIENRLRQQGVDLTVEQRLEIERTLAALARQEQAIRDQQRQAEETARVWQNVTDDIVKFGADAFDSILSSGRDGFQGLFQDILRWGRQTFARLAAEPAVRPVVVVQPK